MAGDRKSIKTALSNHFRGKRDVLLRDAISRCPRRGDGLRILDIGGSQPYWQRVGFDFLAGHSAQITLLNHLESELKVADGAPPGLFATAIGDGRALQFGDYAFDLAHSNSVIEHVGLWRDMAAFAGETRRVAPSYYVQTPNYWYPVEPHFWAAPMVHWLPRPWRAGLMRRLKLAHAGRARDLGEAYAFADSAQLLTRGQLHYLFPEAEIHAERLVLLAKSFTAIHIAANHAASPADNSTANPEPRNA